MDRNSKAQYQHYIPQFLLRNFSFENRKWKKTETRKQLHPGDQVLHAVDLDVAPPKLVKVPVKHTFGNLNMYQDDTKFSPKDQSRIEKKLSNLESATSHIIQRIIIAHKNNEKEISMSRKDKDILRKFLFVMKYRSPAFFQRFNHQSAGDYKAEDRTQFLEYMRKKNYQRPLDVWLNNLSEILDMVIDTERKWMDDLPKRIYPGDAELAITMIQGMYLALCTPSNPNEEFILTENSFSIYEGPVDCSVDRRTAEITVRAYTEFHFLGVISPTLVMVLRNYVLPEPLEDRDESVRIMKAVMLEAQMQFHSDPGNARSVLEDLPTTKARISYAQEASGRSVLAEGRNRIFSSLDVFHFTFFRLSSRHVQMLNSVMLDQACNMSLIVYRSQLALKAALEFYLDMPTQTNGIYSMKTISERVDDPVKQFLEKLEHIARILGSNVKARYYIDSLADRDGDIDFEHAAIEVLKQVSLGVGSKLHVCMEILVKMAQKLELDIGALHALDLIAKPNSVPNFPDVVYRNIQKASQVLHTESSQSIALIERSTWRFSWEALRSIVFERSGRDIPSDIEWLKKMVAESEYAYILPKEDASEDWDNETFAQTRNESTFALGSTPKISHEIRKTKLGHTSLHQGTHLTKDGPRKAFGRIGRDLSGEKSLTSQTVKHIPERGVGQIQQAESSNIDKLRKRNIQREAYAQLKYDWVAKHDEKDESTEVEILESILFASESEELNIGATIAFDGVLMALIPIMLILIVFIPTMRIPTVLTLIEILLENWVGGSG